VRDFTRRARLRPFSSNSARKESAFSVAEDYPPTTETRLEHPILGLKVFDEHFLLPGEPRSECDDQKLN
jgi:hypothetical protein